jgi:hypothetical protein
LKMLFQSPKLVSQIAIIFIFSR